MNASVLDLRYKTREVLKAIDRNEEVSVFYRGRKKAVLVPLRNPGKRGKSSAIPGVGMWKDMKEPVSNMVKRLRQGRFD